MRAFAERPNATQHTSATTSAIPGRSHFGRRPEVRSISYLQRKIGNQAIRQLLEVNVGDVKGDSTTESARVGHDFSRVAARATTPAADQPRVTTATARDNERATELRPHQLPAPSIRIVGFSPPNGLKAGPDNPRIDTTERDKSTTPSTEDQDQSARLSSIAVVTNGVSITVEADGVYTSTEFPDGFRWTQTITTNANKGGPLLATPVNYTDPKPNDDTKPFYWTDAEEATHAGTFEDAPTRKPRPAGTVEWDAILSLNGVNGTSVTRFDSLGYGFRVDSGGTVTQRGPGTPASVSGHLSTLSSEFPGWTFT